jgi:hypothetical protein
VKAQIAVLAELELGVHGRMDAVYPDFPPRPDFVVGDLIELIGLLEHPIRTE